MASERVQIDGTLAYWSETEGRDCDQFAVVLENGAVFDANAVEQVFRKITANGCRVRLIIELPEET